MGTPGTWQNSMCLAPFPSVAGDSQSCTYAPLSRISSCFSCFHLNLSPGPFSLLPSLFVPRQPFWFLSTSTQRGRARIQSGSHREVTIPGRSLVVSEGTLVSPFCRPCTILGGLRGRRKQTRLQEEAPKHISFPASPHLKPAVPWWRSSSNSSKRQRLLPRPSRRHPLKLLTSSF